VYDKEVGTDLRLYVSYLITTPCSLVGIYQRIGATLPPIQGNKDAAGCFGGILATIHQYTE
jgi:hypothetical protein